jgi:hypothetical protein
MSRERHYRFELHWPQAFVDDLSPADLASLDRLLAGHLPISDYEVGEAMVDRPAALLEDD